VRWSSSRTGVRWSSRGCRSVSCGASVPSFRPPGGEPGRPTAQAREPQSADRQRRLGWGAGDTGRLRRRPSRRTTASRSGTGRVQAEADLTSSAKQAAGPPSKKQPRRSLNDTPRRAPSSTAPTRRASRREPRWSSPATRSCAWPSTSRSSTRSAAGGDRRPRRARPDHAPAPPQTPRWRAARGRGRRRSSRGVGLGWTALTVLPGAGAPARHAGLRIGRLQASASVLNPRGALEVRTGGSRRGGSSAARWWCRSSP